MRSILGRMHAVQDVGEQGLVVLKAYFDGGNKADSRQYKVLTLVGVGATDSIWRDVEKRWKAIAEKSGPGYLHMNEAISLKGGFAKDKGWTKDKVLAFCKRLIHGLRGFCNRPIAAASCTVLLEDYKRALAAVPDLPSVEFICAGQCLPKLMLWYARTVLSHPLENRTEFPPKSVDLFFDRKEPFRGHISRFWNSKTHRDHQVWKAIAQLTEVDMRSTPGLQIADMLAWAHSRPYGAGGYQDLCSEIKDAISDDHLCLRYDDLARPDLNALASLKALNFPKHRAMR